MEVVAIAVGLGLVAVSPFVPGLRPVAKSLVAGGLAVAATAKTMPNAVPRNRQRPPWRKR